MTQGHDLSGRLALDVIDECSRVVDPLRPRVDVAAPSIAFAMASQVNRVRRHAVASHTVSEPLVTAAVLA